MDISVKSAALGGDAMIGGRVNVRGNVTFGRNLRVEGWLDAPNIKGPLKGWFRDVATLEKYYRKPQSGWLALVGSTIPAPVYIAEQGEWVLTDSTGGELTVEAGKMAEDLELLQDSMSNAEERVASLEDNLTVTSGDADEFELAVADEEGNVVMGISDGHIRTRNFDSSELREDILVKETDESSGEDDDDESGGNVIDGDLCISDDKGNIIALFADGHIRTRLFDSAEVAGSAGGSSGSSDSIITATKGKFISFLGDSITTFSGFIPDGYLSFYPKGDVTGAEKTYWHIVTEELDMELGRNCSWSGSYVHGNGSSTTSAAAGCSNRRISDLAANGIPDIIVVSIGINDFDDGTPLGNYSAEDQWIADGSYSDFSHSYALMLQKLMTVYPKARIIVCTLMEASFRDADGVYPAIRGDGSRLSDFNGLIRSLADSYGLICCDFHSCGIHWGNMGDYYLDGNLHPNAAGHRLMANRLKGCIISNYL